MPKGFVVPPAIDAQPLPWRSSQARGESGDQRARPCAPRSVTVCLPLPHPRICAMTNFETLARGLRARGP